MVGNLGLSTSSISEQSSTQLQELERPEGELHLRFYLTFGQELAFSAMAIREVLSVPPDRITPIPNTSPLLLGTLNLRGRVLWVADLGQFLGETFAVNTDRAEIPIIAVEDQETIVGLAVEQIVGMEWLDVEAIQQSTATTDSITPYLRGEWLLGDRTHQYLRLLDQKAILRSNRWAAV
ncbi:chemotaxis protein CheW [Gloeocapsopsis dulcis]|uniref:Chemotaxis protein CheW n=1 Tax=Gloeocapsopsis dulcis AAB1 = 1H9 TaxID=1433147 RepID=A0A6N8FZ68_9CHRO|nr:chemotaxis protein CheW [Gloeocapsopsis dulcis]MUL37427.1 chemotaxis protein CheW [Gloeocapsopsis dulcis AAB1 = 1H9]WNN87401.1 chemotaxis protein CheW [Gloeocapsopsis dulcis]